MRLSFSFFFSLWGCVFCLCDPDSDDEAIPLLWPLKPTMGVLCWYIKTGRKGGSRIMQCGAEAQRARVCGCVCVCEAVTHRSCY